MGTKVKPIPEGYHFEEMGMSSTPCLYEGV